MYKRILVIIFLFLPIVSFAQKKQLSEAKSYLKSGNNLDKAESLVREVIAMPGESGFSFGAVSRFCGVEKYYLHLFNFLNSIFFEMS